MKAISSLICTLLALLYCSSVVAEDRVIVVPFLSGNAGKKFKNVVTVAKSGGDFTDPGGAVESITDAREDNPYLVIVGPGVYAATKTIMMKPFVSLSGTGQLVTRIVGSIASGKYSAEASILAGAADSAITDLTIVNNGTHNRHTVGIYSKYDSTIQNTKVIVNGQNQTTGIFIENSNPLISHSTLEVSGTNVNTGISFNNASPRTHNISVDINGGQMGVALLVFTCPSIHIENARLTVRSSLFAFGIDSVDSKASLSRANISVSAQQSAYGIRNGQSDSIINEVVINASGSNGSYGVYNELSSPILTNSIIKASNGTHNYAVYNKDTSFTTIRNSIIESDSFSLYNYDSPQKFHVVGSSLLSGVGVEGFYSCLNSNNGIDKELDSSCAEVTPPVL